MEGVVTRRGSTAVGAAVVSPRLGSLTGRSRRPSCKPCADRANGIAGRHDEGLAVAEMRERGFEPQEPYRGVKYPWRCLCHGCGTLTSPTFGSILAGQSGCRRCADLRAAAPRREEPERAAASMREADFGPLEPYTTSMTPWRCRCTACGPPLHPHPGQGPQRPRVQVLRPPRLRPRRARPRLRRHPRRPPSRQDRCRRRPPAQRPHRPARPLRMGAVLRALRPHRRRRPGLWSRRSCAGCVQPATASS